MRCTPWSMSSPPPLFAGIGAPLLVVADAPAVAVAPADEHDVAALARVEDGARLLRGGVEAVVVADLHDDALLGRSLRASGSISAALRRRGLLDDDVLAGAHRGQRQRRELVVRRGDDDGVRPAPAAPRALAHDLGLVLARERASPRSRHRGRTSRRACRRPASASARLPPMRPQPTMPTFITSHSVLGYLARHFVEELAVDTAQRPARRPVRRCGVDALDLVPLRAEHLARQRAARLGREPHDQLRGEIGRFAAALPLLQRPLVERLAGLLGTRGDDAAVISVTTAPGRDRVDLDVVVGELARERLGELDHRRLRRGVRAPAGRHPGRRRRRPRGSRSCPHAACAWWAARRGTRASPRRRSPRRRAATRRGRTPRACRWRR